METLLSIPLHSSSFQSSASLTCFTGCEEQYFHWNYRRSTLKVLPILIAYFPQKYVGEYFVYTTSLFYFK
jgi:hypothetical protein